MYMYICFTRYIHCTCSISCVLICIVDLLFGLCWIWSPTRLTCPTARAPSSDAFPFPTTDTKHQRVWLSLRGLARFECFLQLNICGHLRSGCPKGLGRCCKPPWSCELPDHIRGLPLCQQCEDALQERCGNGWCCSMGMGNDVEYIIYSWWYRGSLHHCCCL